MTANSVGYLTGSLLCGVLFDSYNKLFLLFLAVFGNAVTAAIIPWCFVYEIMVIMHIAKGTFCGALDASKNSQFVFWYLICFETWVFCCKKVTCYCMILILDIV